MLIDKMEIEVSNSKSILSFEKTGGGNWKEWDRYISVNGEKSFHIGNICGTCAFFFERLGEGKKGINIPSIVDELSVGLKGLNRQFIENVGMIMPNGKYKVLLTEVSPTLSSPGIEGDYFSDEQVLLWGIDSSIGKPHAPGTKYYRLATRKLSNGRGFFEFLIPIVSLDSLDQDRLKKYREEIRSGKKPTIITLSVLDVKQPANWEDEIPITSHWCLAHYLIDGHHKAYAAALENLPLTAVSFLAIDQGICSDEEIAKALVVMKGES